MKLLKSSQSGQTMIMALMLLALGSLLVVPLLNHSFTNLGYHQSIECKTLNDYSADAGVEYATCKLYNEPGHYMGTPLQDGFSINGRTVNVTAEYMGGGVFSINSTASGGGCGKTTIKSFVNLSIGAFSFAVAAKVHLDISGAVIDSAPDPGYADIYSNGDIEIGGSDALVNGNAFTVGTITSGSEKVVGIITEGAVPLEFPLVNAELYENIAKEGGTYEGDLRFDDGTYYVGPLYITGELEVKSGANVTLEGPLYVVGDVTVNQGHMDGQEHILTEGNVDITGGGYGSSDIPVIISLYGYIDCVGPVVDAVVYAPYGEVRLQNLHLYGALGGNEVRVSNAIVTYAQSLDGRWDLPGASLYPLTYSYE